MVKNPSKDFAELTTVQLCWFPVPLNKTAFDGYELGHECLSQLRIEWRCQLTDESSLVY